MSHIMMLGTGNAMCTRCYNTCFYLRTPAGGLMVDAGGGNGIFRQLYRGRVAFEEIHHLFVTHCHSDHLLGAIWMIRKISPMIHNGKHHGKFTIYCHNEVRDALMQICHLVMPTKISRALGEGITLQEVHDGEEVAIDDIEVTFFDIGSTKAKQFGFSATLPDGKRLACLGDEPYNERTERYVKGCDWMMCEAFCLYKDREIFRPYEKHHSTVADSAKVAEQLGVKNLLLYHTEDTHLATRALNYTTEAKQHYSGRVIVPSDLERIEL